MRSWRVALAFDLSAQFTSWVPRSFAHFAKGRVADSKCRVFLRCKKNPAPSHIHLYRPSFIEQIKTMTAPMPLFGQIHQFALHGIASYPPLRQAQGRLLLKTQGRDAHSFGSGRKSRSGRKLGDRRDVPQLKLSDPILPISRLPVTVGDSQDSNHRFPLVVNHSIWKTTENKLPGVEVTSWPTSGVPPVRGQSRDLSLR